MPPGPRQTDIVLVGGGHAHVHVVTALAKRARPRLRVTLISREIETPYSGMLPGIVAGLYRREEAHIDLRRLAAATGTRLVHAEATGLDRAGKRVLLAGGPPIPYDLVSINVGITPALDAIEGARQHGIAVKPIGSFLAKLDALLDACHAADGPRRIVVAGGGAAGVELLLSVRTRLLREAVAGGIDPRTFRFTLVAGGEFLPAHNGRVRGIFREVFDTRGIATFRQPAVALRAGCVALANGATIAADAVLLSTQAAAPAWFRETGLTLDGGGFIAVGPTLQALNDAAVFAAGDCAAIVGAPREKAGVYAVRAGPPLADNLLRCARGEAPGPWSPQRRHLAIISTGKRYAVASRGPFALQGRWVWRLKDWIDRRWIRTYQEFDPNPSKPGAKRR